MKFFLFITITLLSQLANAAPALPDFFVGDWSGFTKACGVGDKFEVAKDHFVLDDETKTFRVLKSTDFDALVELTSKLQCEASCESKYFRFSRLDAKTIALEFGDKIKGDRVDGGSLCAYSRGWKEPPKAKKAKLLHDQDGAVLVCESGQHLIRIDKTKDTEKYRYRSYKLHAAENSKPELELLGIVEVEGSANNATYVFKSGPYKYEISDDNVCSKEEFDESINRCIPRLTITKGKKSISSAKCHP